MKTLSHGSLNEVTRHLAAEFQPERQNSLAVWLFGSHAWGQPDEGSDLDLLVVVRHSDEPTVRRAQWAHRCLQEPPSLREKQTSPFYDLSGRYNALNLNWCAPGGSG